MLHKAIVLFLSVSHGVLSLNVPLPVSYTSPWLAWSCVTYGWNAVGMRCTIHIITQRESWFTHLAKNQHLTASCELKNPHPSFSIINHSVVFTFRVTLFIIEMFHYHPRTLQYQRKKCSPLPLQWDWTVWVQANRSWGHFTCNSLGGKHIKHIKMMSSRQTEPALVWTEHNTSVLSICTYIFAFTVSTQTHTTSTTGITGWGQHRVSTVVIKLERNILLRLMYM